MDPRAPTHMTPDDISSYLARSVPRDRRDAIAEHLAACDECRGDLISASQALEREARRRRAMLVLPSAAAAILALFFLLPVGGPETAGPELPPVRSEPTEAVRTFETISPGDGEEVVVGSVRFEWQSEGPEARYRLTVTNQIGDVVWEESTDETDLELPSTVALEPGEPYFWRVDALLPGAQSSTTGFHAFVVAVR